MNCRLSLLYLLVLSPLLPVGQLQARTGAPPNIIIILADDLGWGDLSAYGATRISTPEVDRLAAQGVRFDQFYAASPVCSPSRASLLSGRYPFRSGVTRVLHPGTHRGIPASEELLPEMLQTAGYRTGLVGKWHLGESFEHLPLQNGFDEFYGIPYSNNMHPLYYMDGNQKLGGKEPTAAHLTGHFTQAAIDFVSRHRDSPFFLLLSHAMPHYPIDAGGNWRGSSRDGRYGDVIQELDGSVGEIVRHLEKLDLDRRTVVFFTSDNGSWRRRSNFPLRGKKRSGWEGGFRVPLIAWGPGHFGRGLVVEHPAMMFDLYATSLVLAGLSPPADLEIDGKSILPLLTGSLPTPQDRGPLDLLFFFRQGRIDAIRQGQWKLHVARTSRVFGRHLIEPELYDLAEDPEEKVNLANRRPRLVEQLALHIQSFREQNPTAPHPVESRR